MPSPAQENCAQQKCEEREAWAICLDAANTTGASVIRLRCGAGGRRATRRAGFRGSARGQGAPKRNCARVACAAARRRSAIADGTSSGNGAATFNCNAASPDCAANGNRATYAAGCRLTASSRRSADRRGATSARLAAASRCATTGQSAATAGRVTAGSGLAAGSRGTAVST